MTGFFDSPLQQHLQVGEEILTLAGTEGELQEQGIRVAVTNQRVIVFREESQRMKDQRVTIEYSVLLPEIQSVWEHIEGVTKTVVLKTSQGTYTLPELYVDAERVTNILIETQQLVPKEEAEEDAVDTWKERIHYGLRFAGTGGALAITVLGIIVVVIGIFMTLSVFGFLFGIPFYLLGAAIMMKGIELLLETEDKTRQEWVRPEHWE